MKSRRIYDTETFKKDHKFNNLLRNTPKMSSNMLLEESDRLWREKVKREKMARERKRKLRQQREGEETTKKEMSDVECDKSYLSS